MRTESPGARRRQRLRAGSPASSPGLVDIADTSAVMAGRDGLARMTLS
ncbi:hypothetical protein STXM2123_5945 [Streptomyces sp. F-3]|nr:hypothetical protein STXM2123_5945 [Streptomyces sp. F-3]